MKFTITSVAPSIDKNTGQQYIDQYGNRSFSVFLNDEQGQTTNILKRVKQGNPDPRVGDVLEGSLEMKTSKTGRTYHVFVPEKKEFDKKGYSSDPNTMLLSYAKDIVVALINNAEKGKLTTENIKDDLTILNYHFKGLYEDLKGEKAQSTTEAPKTPHSTPQDETPPPHTDEEIDISEIPWE